jgi:hypothetical protein
MTEILVDMYSTLVKVAKILKIKPPISIFVQPTAKTDIPVVDSTSSPLFQSLIHTVSRELVFSRVSLTAQEQQQQ